jgi:hypothetical protein
MDFKLEDFEVESKLIVDDSIQDEFSHQENQIELPWELLTDERILPSALKLYLIIKKFAKMDHDGKRAFPTRKHLAKMMGISHQQIDKLKKQLKDAGYLTWTQEPGKKSSEKPWHNVYVLRYAVSMEQLKLLHTHIVAPTNRVGGLTPPPSPKATGGGRSPKKKITRQKFIELADQEIPSWRDHYKINYEEGQWYYYGLSEVFSNWLDENEKDYQEKTFDSPRDYPWERKLELLKKFLDRK